MCDPTVVNNAIQSSSGNKVAAVQAMRAAYPGQFGAPAPDPMASAQMPSPMAPGAGAKTLGDMFSGAPMAQPGLVPGGGGGAASLYAPSYAKVKMY